MLSDDIGGDTAEPLQCDPAATLNLERGTPEAQPAMFATENKFSTDFGELLGYRHVKLEPSKVWRRFESNLGKAGATWRSHSSSGERATKM
jgi:hypothetical protein